MFSYRTNVDILLVVSIKNEKSNNMHLQSEIVSDTEDLQNLNIRDGLTHTANSLLLKILLLQQNVKKLVQKLLTI